MFSGIQPLLSQRDTLLMATCSRRWSPPIHPSGDTVSPGNRLNRLLPDQYQACRQNVPDLISNWKPGVSLESTHHSSRLNLRLAGFDKIQSTSAEPSVFEFHPLLNSRLLSHSSRRRSSQHRPRPVLCNSTHSLPTTHVSTTPQLLILTRDLETI